MMTCPLTGSNPLIRTWFLFWWNIVPRLAKVINKKDEPKHGTLETSEKRITLSVSPKHISSLLLMATATNAVRKDDDDFRLPLAGYFKSNLAPP